MSSISNTNGFGTDVVSGSPNSNDSNLLTAKRTYVRDAGTDGTAQAGKNALFSINHTSGVNTLDTVQDRTLWVSMSNPAGDTGTRYAINSIQAETFINGTPSWQAGNDTEAKCASLQTEDNHTGNISSPGSGVGVVRAQFFRNANAGCWSTPNAVITGLYSNLSTQSGNGQAFDVFAARWSENGLNDGTMNIPVAGFHAYAPTFRFKNNYGVYIDNFGSNTNDRNLVSAGSMPSNGITEFQGPVLLPNFTPASAAATGIAGSIAWDSGFIYVCTATNTWKRSVIATW